MPALPPPPLSLDDRLASSAFGYGRDRLYTPKLTAKDIASVKTAGQELLNKTLAQATQDLIPLYARAQEIGLSEATIAAWHAEITTAEAELKQKFAELTATLVELEKELPKEDEIKPLPENKINDPAAL